MITKKQVKNLKLSENIITDYNDDDYTAFEVFPTNEIITAGTESDVEVYGEYWESNRAYSIGEYVLCPTLKKIYTCIKAIAKTANIEPGVSENWSEYWEEGNEHFDGFYHKYKVDVPAYATCKLQMYTYKSKQEECDVVIDWGDGTISKIADLTDTSIESFSDYSTLYGLAYNYSNFYVSHTYSDENCGKKFIVKIYGKDYFMFRAYDSTKGHNIISRILDKDLKLASNITNISSLCRNSLKLLLVVVPYCITHTVNMNITSAFRDCENLRYFYAENLFATIPYEMSQLFRGCKNLECDINNFNSIARYGCYNLNYGWLFRDCIKIFGTVQPKIYWENPANNYYGEIGWSGSTFSGGGGCFIDCNDELLAQVPESWGGTKKTT